MKLQRIWRKITAAGLALVLAALCVGCKQETPVAEEPKQPTAAEAQIGDVVYGFALAETEELPILDATMTVWRHEMTGAEVYFIRNNDPELGFTMCLRTETPDESALPQILSEMIGDSTKDYPGTNVMEAAKKSAYVTDLGTFVTPASTGYYVTSLSEEQLEKMTDYYLDCAFYSDFAEHENFFNYNVVRRHLSNPNSAIELTGVVYNDRREYHSTITTAHFAHICQTLFPDTYQRFTGMPQAVREVTVDDVVQYYKEVYHPSNMTCMFYGDLEEDRFLKRLDREFSKFDCRNYEPSAGQGAFAEPVRAEYLFPANQTDGIGAVISYSVVLPQELTFAELTALKTGASVLNNENSALMKQLKQAKIAGAYSVSFRQVGDQAVLCFQAQGADTARAEEFRQIVLTNLQTQDEALVQSFYDALRLQQAMIRNNAGIGKTMGQKLVAMVDTGDREQLRHWAFSEEAYKLSKDGGLAGLLTRAVCENPHSALVITVPDQALMDKERSELQQPLDEEKAAMTEDEILALMRYSRDIEKWAARLTHANTLDYLCVAPEEIEAPTLPVYETTQSTHNGVVFRTAQVAGDIVSCKVQYDLSHLTLDQVRLMHVYIQLMGHPTGSREREQVQMEMRSLLRNFDIQVSTALRKDKTAYPVLNVSFDTTASAAKQAAELVMDMLTHTRLEAPQNTIPGVIDRQMRNYQDPVRAMTTLAVRGALAGSSDASATEYAIFDLSFYSRLLNLRYTDPYVVYEQLLQTRDAALVRSGTTVFVAADPAVNTSEVLAPLAGQDTQTTPDPYWSTIVRAETTAMGIKGTGEVCYGLALLQTDCLDIPVSAELMLCADILEDRYLTPRYENEKLDSSANAYLAENGMFLVQMYRVKEFEESVKELAAGLPDEIVQELENLTNAELASYQRSRLAELGRSSGCLKEAMEQLQYEQIGLSAAQRQSMLEDVLEASPTSVTDAAEQMDEILDAAVWAVIAPGEAIDKGAYLFDRMELLP